MALKAKGTPRHGIAEKRCIGIVVDAVAAAALKGIAATGRLEQGHSVDFIANYRFNPGGICPGHVEVDGMVVPQIRTKLGIADNQITIGIHGYGNTIGVVVHGTAQPGGPVMTTHAKKRDGVAGKRIVRRLVIERGRRGVEGKSSAEGVVTVPERNVLRRVVGGMTEHADLTRGYACYRRL